MTRPEQVSDTELRYSWSRDDFESKLGFHGGRFTGVNHFLWFLVGGAATALFYWILHFWPRSPAVQMFTERGPVQYVTIFFFFWTVATLLAKAAKTRVQKRTLEWKGLVPASGDFVLSPATVDDVLGRLNRVCDDRSAYVLFNRIELALSNLQNMGQIGDVDAVLRSHASDAEDVMESSYSIVRGLVYALPVLGFIATVLGLSEAMGGFGEVLAHASDIEKIKDALKPVTAGLATAFETTFTALVAALLSQLLVTFVRKSEEELLDSCKEYCQRYIVGKLRLLPR